MKFIELVIDVENEVGIERRDGEEKRVGVDRVVNGLLIKFYLRKQWLKLENELSRGFAVGDVDGKKVFLVSVRGEVEGDIF